MPVLRLTVAYQGSRYTGWQLQAHKNAPQPATIQGELERAASSILRVKRAVVAGASRTDAGVHAEGQVCALAVPQGAERIDWLRALNSRLPDDIRVIAADFAPEGFDPRRSVRSKCYCYTIWAAHARPLPRLAPFVGAFPPLDFDLLDVALPHFLGLRDRACLQNAGAQPVESTVRSIFSLRRLPGRAGPLLCPPEWPVHGLFVEGDGFLKQMVRNMVGLLVWVGLGKIRPDEVPDLLARTRREDLPSPTAPAAGLTLMRIDYYEAAPNTSFVQ